MISQKGPISRQRLVSPHAFPEGAAAGRSVCRPARQQHVLLPPQPIRQKSNTITESSNNEMTRAASCWEMFKRGVSQHSDDINPPLPTTSHPSSPSSSCHNLAETLSRPLSSSPTNAISFLIWNRPVSLPSLRTRARRRLSTPPRSKSLLSGRSFFFPFLFLPLLHP